MAIGAVAVPFAPDVGVICPLRRVTGVPCPFCGMTTGVLRAGEADLGASLAANPLALVLLAVVVVAFVPARLRPRLPVAALSPPRFAAVAVALLAASWLFQLARFDLI